MHVRMTYLFIKKKEKEKKECPTYENHEIYMIVSILIVEISQGDVFLTRLELTILN